MIGSVCLLIRFLISHYRPEYIGGHLKGMCAGHGVLSYDVISEDYSPNIGVWGNGLAWREAALS